MITSCLKKILRLFTKSFVKKAIKTLSVQHLRSVFESAWLQKKIEAEGIETIYIDEFKVSTKYNDFYGWIKRGQRGYIKLDPNSFDMSFIWAVSRFKVYVVWVSEITLWSDGVEYFIEQLVASRRVDGKVKDTPFVSIRQCFSAYVLEGKKVYGEFQIESLLNSSLHAVT